MTVESTIELSAADQQWQKRLAVCCSLLPDPLAVICADFRSESDAKDFFKALFPHPVGDGDDDCLRCGEQAHLLQLGLCETCWNNIQANYFTRHAGVDGEVWL